MSYGVLDGLESEAMLIISDSLAEIKSEEDIVGMWIEAALLTLSDYRFKKPLDRISIVQASRVTTKHLKQYNDRFAILGIRKEIDAFIALGPLPNAESLRGELYKTVRVDGKSRDEYRFPDIVENVIDEKYSFDAVCIERPNQLFTGIVDIQKSKRDNVLVMPCSSAAVYNWKI